MDVSGWSAYCDQKREDDLDDWIFANEKSPEETIRVRAMLDFQHNMEAQFKKEDIDMLIRLINLRDELWT